MSETKELAVRFESLRAAMRKRGLAFEDGATYDILGKVWAVMESIKLDYVRVEG